VINRCRPSAFNPQNLPKERQARRIVSLNSLKPLALPRGDGGALKKAR
jgi:hypothetical protein